MPRSVALHGPSGSGKSTVARLFERYGYQHLKTGAACRRLCRELFGSESKSLMNAVTDALRGIDQAVWIRAALAGADSARPVVFDSIRFDSDYEYFERLGYHLVSVRSSHGARAERLRARGQEFDPTNDHLHAAESELSHHHFATIINNDGDLARLEGAVHELISSL